MSWGSGGVLLVSRELIRSWSRSNGSGETFRPTRKVRESEFERVECQTSGAGVDVVRIG